MFLSGLSVIAYILLIMRTDLVGKAIQSTQYIFAGQKRPERLEPDRRSIDFPCFEYPQTYIGYQPGP